MQRFADLQAGLGTVLRSNSVASRVPHVVIALPSYSLTPAVASHYGARIRALEHRYVVSSLLTHRLPHASWLFVGSLSPSPEILGYYRDLGPDPTGFTQRTHVVALEDLTARPAAEKLLDRPDLIDAIKRYVGGRQAVIEPWNVTDAEVAVAEALGMPINGMDPRLIPAGFKSAGRRLFAAAGVPVPVGVEDVRSPQDIVNAIESIRRRRPTVRSVVVKHDDSVAGDGNLVVPVCDRLGQPLPEDEIEANVLGLPVWFLADLGKGGVVEELVMGDRVTSPSVQLELTPHEGAVILSTHEQELGGEHGQVFLGCRFPADPAYATAIARHAERVGNLLVNQGVAGRASIDFMASRDRGGSWQVVALEVNLRKGGTTHPYSALRNLVPGRYDVHSATWVADSDGLARTYTCTDNLVDPGWTGLSPAAVVNAVRSAGLEFDSRRGHGVVLHMLSGLGIDGRFGFTAIGSTEVETAGMAHRVRGVIERAVRDDAEHPRRLTSPVTVSS